MTTWTGSVPTISAGETTGVAAKLATYRDVMKALSETWTAFGTGANWTAVTTPPAIGNGAWLGRYKQVGKDVDFWVRITMGSTTTYGAGLYQIILPVAPFATHPCHFDVVCTDTGTATYRGVTGQLSASTKVNLLVNTGTAGGALAAVAPTVPFTWGNTDVLEISGSYEAA